MESFGTGLALILNGLLEMLHGLFGWQTLLALALLGSLLYLASTEIAELDRSTSKPNVERH